MKNSSFYRLSEKMAPYVLLAPFLFTLIVFLVCICKGRLL